VLCTGDGDLLDSLPPYEVAVPWWQETGPVVAAAQERFGVAVTVLRLLEAAAGWGTAGGSTRRPSAADVLCTTTRPGRGRGLGRDHARGRRTATDRAGRTGADLDPFEHLAAAHRRRHHVAQGGPAVPPTLHGVVHRRGLAALVLDRCCRSQTAVDGLGILTQRSVPAAARSQAHQTT
jgi:hypothetical protein